MKENKGITLIALVITIIVLLILAGVSIAMLTGENGVLTQANRAKVTQIEGQVDEEVKLAVQAAKMYAEEQAVNTPNGFMASENISANSTGVNGQKTIIQVLETDLKTGYTITAEGTTITIKYVTDDYKKATNNSGAYIQQTVTVSGNTFTLDEPTFNPAHTN